MEKFSRNSTAALVVSFALVALSLTGPIAAFAATSPALGAAATFGVLAGTYTNTAAGTINGDLGYTTLPAVPPTMNGTTHVADATYTTAGINQGTALSTLNALTCDFTFGSATDLSLLPQPLVPGVYCVTGAQSIGTGGITLSGAGTYVFRSTGALNTVANSHVVLAGASACDVFWTPGAATTLGANSTFVGTDIDDAGITVGSTVAWTGRALAFATTVTTNADTITVPTCALPPVTTATLHVVKTVVNNNGGTALVSAFNLHVKLSGTDVSGSPMAGVVSPGRPYTLAAGTYNVSEDANVAYTHIFSGDCDVSGNVVLAAGNDKTCTITNDDIAVVPGTATLHVVKTVVNNNGGTALVSAFNLHVKLSGTDVSGSPMAGVVSPGRPYTLAAGTYNVSEDANVAYTHIFSGDCDVSGNVVLAAGNDKTCTITNDDVAPLVVAPVLNNVSPILPVLPKTGVAPAENIFAWPIAAAFVFSVSLFLYVIQKKKNS